jgi:hypothetical protein
MHEVRNYFVRMSGLPRFDGTFKNYPAFERKWESYESIITVWRCPSQPDYIYLTRVNE